MGTDSLCYIMDYSGNYYGINRADQLVAVTGEQDATIFTFAQANSRICVGKKSSFYCIVPIPEDYEEDVNKDEEIQNKAVNEEDDFTNNEDDHIEENNTGEEQDVMDYESDIQEEQDSIDDKPDIQKQPDDIVEEDIQKIQDLSYVKKLTYNQVLDPVERNVYSYDLAEMDWEEYLTHFTYVVKDISNYEEELRNKLSDIDMKLCDILHYIELCETDYKENVELVELIRVCRESRRDIKDEIYRVECFQNNLGTKANATKANQALKNMASLKTRKYTPRKFGELFKKSVWLTKHIRKEDIQDTEYYNNEESQDFIKKQYIDEDEGGERTMIQEKKYTPFDGKDNDWVEFARQQAEFYRNAGDYINNLQQNISEIDDEIEEILLETEDANCNVAQGYKVFKRLKDLRIERKAKSRELDCMYALTDYINCEALAETCEANFKEVEEIMGCSEQKNILEIEHPENKEEYVSDKVTNMVG